MKTKKKNIEDPLKKEREKKIKEVEEDEAALKKIEYKEKSGDDEPKPKKVRTGSGSGHQYDKSKEQQHALGMAATLKMVETDKEKIEAEVQFEERKAKEAEKSIRPDSWEAEEKRSNLRKRGRRDPNNPTKEEVDAQQEVENLTWADRWMKNKKVKHVVQSSKMMSKVKFKMKADQKEKKTAEAETEPEKPGTSQESKGATIQGEESNDGKAPEKAARPVPTNNELPKGMIGSLEEYAQIVGKSVSQLADAKYEPPEVSDSESEDEQPAEGEGDLWGAIMGN